MPQDNNTGCNSAPSDDDEIERISKLLELEGVFPNKPGSQRIFGIIENRKDIGFSYINLYSSKLQVYHKINELATEEVRLLLAESKNFDFNEFINSGEGYFFTEFCTKKHTGDNVYEEYKLSFYGFKHGWRGNPVSYEIQFMTKVSDPLLVGA
jgi:hypothetical protein